MSHVLQQLDCSNVYNYLHFHEYTNRMLGTGSEALRFFYVKKSVDGRLMWLIFDVKT